MYFYLSIEHITMWDFVQPFDFQAKTLYSQGGSHAGFVFNSRWMILTVENATDAIVNAMGGVVDHVVTLTPIFPKETSTSLSDQVHTQSTWISLFGIIIILHFVLLKIPVLNLLSGKCGCNYIMGL